MSTKINQVLQNWPPNAVGTLRWLKRFGIDRRHANRYVQSEWLERVGHGAYKRTGAGVDWPGAVFALQSQLNLDLHPGGISALEMRGFAHNIVLGEREITLFGATRTKLPSWFVNQEWTRPVTLVTTSVFPAADNQTSPLEINGLTLDVATLERAAFEMMYLVPKRQSYEEAVQIMETLTTLRPKVVQQLLENCSSVKTKRLFMHTVESLSLPWVSRVNLSKVDFGSGRRTIHPGGRLETKYDLVIDETLYA